MDIIRLDEIMDLTKAPSDEGAVAKGDWGSEKVVNISCFVFRCQSMNKNNKSNYPQRTKRAEENTFSLLPPQAVPPFLAKTANPLSLRDISLSKGILVRGRLGVSRGLSGGGVLLGLFQPHEFFQ